MKMDYEQWYEMNYEHISETYEKVLSHLRHHVEIYLPIYNYQVDEYTLFDDIATHMYDTSYNASKRYPLR